MDATGLLPFSFLLLLAGHRAFAASDAGGFSVEFIHRDSPRSPFHNPALSPHGRMLAAARRSLRGDPSRGAPPAPSPAADVVGAGGVESKIISRSFEYLMAVNVGTPPTHMLAIADTGSDLVWVNCRSNTSSAGVARGGDGGGAAGGVVFRPSSLSTYDVVGCETEACQNLNRASCDASSNCRYQYSYGDGSRTTGVLSTETFVFSGDGDRQVSVPHVDFGCSTYMAGTFRADGLVGLGAGGLSLVSQLGSATSFGRRFSYCLMPAYAANSSSTLNFGSNAVVSEPSAATTPLVPGEVDSYYTVALEAVSVAGAGDIAAGGSTQESSSSSTSSIIVDSGTTLTFLDPSLLQPVVKQLEERINLTQTQSPEKLLELCYDVSGTTSREDWGIPDVTLRFGGGGEVTLRPENTFVLVQESTLCLALVSVSEAQPVSILGNVAQQNFHVGYDLDARTVTFAPADCTRSSASS
nr:unnamed protein product [Digitaria exilis]